MEAETKKTAVLNLFFSLKKIIYVYVSNLFMCGQYRMYIQSMNTYKKYYWSNITPIVTNDSSF